MSYQYSDTCLIIFAKAPIIGKVKTRLIPALGAEGACQLYEEMARKIIVNLSESKICQAKVYSHLDITHQFFKDLEISNALKVYPQHGNDLGERMFQAVKSRLIKFSKVIVIGTDCPDYSADYIESAIHVLDKKDVVIGPATDGGYVLIGMKTPEPHVFTQIKWGQNTVLEKTLERLIEKSLTYQLLSPLHDIDVPADLKHLQ